MTLNPAAAPYSLTVTTPTLNYCKIYEWVCMCVLVACSQAWLSFAPDRAHPLASLLQRFYHSPRQSARAAPIRMHS